MVPLGRIPRIANIVLKLPIHFIILKHSSVRLLNLRRLAKVRIIPTLIYKGNRRALYHNISTLIPQRHGIIIKLRHNLLKKLPRERRYMGTICLQWERLVR